MTKRYLDQDDRLEQQYHRRDAMQFVWVGFQGILFDIDLLEPFEGLSVRAIDGKKYPLETDPNELHRIAAMDTPPFHEIYQITSTT